MTSKRTSDSRTTPATPDAELGESFSSPSSGDLAAIISTGDYRASLVAIRDRLADEADDTRWAQHKNVCHCECGMGDGRTLIAVVKELRVLLAVLDALPNAERKSRSDELADRRARRLADAANQ